MSRPDHVICVRDSRPDRDGKALCGRHVAASFAFASVDHWLQNSLQGGRLVGCPGCLKIIRSALVREDAAA